MPTVTFRLLFVLVILAYDRRRIVHVAVTDHPTAAWTAQQLRNAFSENDAPKYLLHDRDSVFADVAGTIAGMNTAAVRTAPRSPWQNAYVERIIGSIRRECLDHVIVLNEAGLQQILTFAREPISRSPKTRRVRVQSHRHQPVASSLFLKSAVCITGMTGSLRSHYTVASVPVTADRNKRLFNTSVLACITADVRDLKSTGRLHDEDLHGVARFESGVPSSHFDFSVGTGGVY